MSTSENQMEQEQEIQQAPAVGFELGSMRRAIDKENTPVTFQVKGPDDKPLFYTDADGVRKPVTWSVLGSRSSKAKGIEQEQRKRRLKASNLTGEAIRADSLEKVARCTTGFEGFHEDGRPVSVTVENAHALLAEFDDVLAQVSEQMGDHEGFTKRG